MMQVFSQVVAVSTGWPCDLEAHIARPNHPKPRKHLADYVLVWAGERETDLRISTHFARIGNSVFPDPWDWDPLGE